MSPDSTQAGQHRATVLAVVLSLPAGGSTAQAAAPDDTVAERTFATPTRWHADLLLRLPDPVLLDTALLDGGDDPLPLSELRTELVLACAAASGTRPLRVRCEVHDAGLLARPAAQDRGSLGAHLSRMEDRVEDASLTLRFGRRGDLRDVDLRLPDDTSHQEARLLGNLVSQALGPLDLPSPALDPDQLDWTQRQPAVVTYPSMEWSRLNQGSPVTLGRLAHTAVATRDGWIVSSQGEGQVSGRGPHTVTVRCAAWLTPDSRLQSRGCELRGRADAQPFPYLADGGVRRLDDDDMVDALASGEL